MAKIRVTIWNEFYHEKNSNDVKKLYPNGIHAFLKDALACEEFEITLASLDMEPDHGLTQEVLNNTDVLIWWGHCRHAYVSDEVAYRVYQRVLNGMGFIPLHSSHRSKPFYTLMGTDCTLRWRNWAEHCRIWNVNPTHPISKDIPMSFELKHEEMYGEYFNIPKPDDLIFVTWFAGGEIFRGGCTFTRGNGKIFYFHPGHENCPTYYNPTIIKIIKNAIFWAAPTTKRNFKSGEFKLPDEKIKMQF